MTRAYERIYQDIVRVKVLFLSQVVPYPPHGGVLQRGYNVLRQLSRQLACTCWRSSTRTCCRRRRRSTRAAARSEQFCAAVEYFPLWVKTVAAPPGGRPRR